MKDLVDTTEMYLRTIYELEEEGITPLRARIAERLEQSGPTVSQTVARMERDGLLHVRSDRSLDLTPRGRELATAVMRKHRLAERLLTDVLGLDILKVHDEACRWEHVMSEEVERRLIHILDNPSISPFGNPIPALEKIGTETSTFIAGERAIDIPNAQDVHATISQINEILQVNREVLQELYEAGVTIGATVTLHREGVFVTLTGPEKSSVTLEDDFAHAIRIKRA
ncbi:MAG: iron dependent repressor, metal binding and dimerization domain protein [Corynebacterium sp.]|nr:iron dependent repressor, metal binding and dimerization domain protein [Corynebacterium sp.]